MPRILSKPPDQNRVHESDRQRDDCNCWRAESAEHANVHDHTTAQPAALRSEARATKCTQYSLPRAAAQLIGLQITFMANAKCGVGSGSGSAIERVSAQSFFESGDNAARSLSERSALLRPRVPFELLARRQSPYAFRKKVVAFEPLTLVRYESSVYLFPCV